MFYVDFTSVMYNITQYMDRNIIKVILVIISCSLLNPGMAMSNARECLINKLLIDEYGKLVAHSQESTFLFHFGNEFAGCTASPGTHNDWAQGYTIGDGDNIPLEMVFSQLTHLATMYPGKFSALTRTHDQVRSARFPKTDERNGRAH